MPSPFQANGAAVDPSKSAPLHTGRFFTGLWTQRSPLRDAATPYLYEKFYSASRYDSLIGGANTEVTTRLTLARRPGSTVYLSTFLGAAVPQILRMYEWRTYVNSAEVIRLIGDTGTQIIELTAATQATNMVGVTKAGGAVTATFQSVGNALYFADGINAYKWLAGSVSWLPNLAVNAGAYLVDTNGNLQYSANGGGTGTTEPTWSTTFGATTADGTAAWVNRGYQVQNWGVAGPTSAPGFALVAATQGNVWQANTYYNSSQVNFVPLSSGSYALLSLTTPGTTASTAPTFNVTLGATTTDGTAVWTCTSVTGSWVAGAAVPKGTLIVAASTPSGFPLCIYMATTSGTSGTSTPGWLPGNGSQVPDNNVLWVNTGIANDLQNSLRSTTVTAVMVITDSSGGQQTISRSGLSGATAPMWAELLGQQTVDTSTTLDAVWTNTGIPPSTTTAWMYAYAFRDSLTGEVSTASPITGPVIPVLGDIVQLSGPGSTDPQYDTIRLYRTVQGGSTLLFMADIPAPPMGAGWTYLDGNPDSALNPLIQAQIASSSNPPPPTLTGLCYYLERIWAFDGNVLRYSGGPDTLSGVGNEAWPPLNSFTFPATGLFTWPTTIGLLAFTQADVYIIQGQGTSSSPFYATIFQEGVGLLNYDSFAVNGSTAYMMTTAQRLISFDPSAGETEVGFPIGDILETAYDNINTRLAYHEGSSADTALYAADGHVGWYRLSTISAPESGQVWSPQAVLQAGVASIASIEIQPGVKRLLYSLYGGGPILMRNASVFTDNGSTYAAYAVIGSIVLAQPGQIAGVQFITLDSLAVGTQATVGVLFNEIAGTFVSYAANRQDPTTLPPSKSLTGQRYYLSQNGNTPLCRHMQVRISWPAENAANELLAYTTFGFLKNELTEK
jgi:hypothetical protein